MSLPVPIRGPVDLWWYLLFRHAWKTQLKPWKKDEVAPRAFPHGPVSKFVKTIESPKRILGLQRNLKLKRLHSRIPIRIHILWRMSRAFVKNFASA